MRAGEPADTYYYGLVSELALSTTAGVGLTGHAAAGLELFSVGRTDVSGGGTADGADFAVAHEMGHAFGRRHVSSTAPGCFGTPASSTVDSSYPNHPSPFLTETGFDPATKKSYPADKFTDFMSYCVPSWVSSYTYKGILAHVQSLGTLSEVGAATAVPGQYWLVSGELAEDSVTFDPLFQFEVTAALDDGTGDYRAEVRDAAGVVLFSRFLQPASALAHDYEGPLRFALLLPVDDAATAIVLVAPDGTELGTIDLAGAPPDVSVSFPVGGEVLDSVHDVTWEVTDPDSAGHTFWVEYSADDGATWGTLASDIEESQFSLNFGRLAGSVAARIRVVASDGVNSGVGISGPFTVPSKPPTARIVFPTTETAFPQEGQLVWLQGSALDAENGYLDDVTVSWSSDVDGFLGNGTDLPVYDLTEGRHEITLTAIDSDGNMAMDSIIIAVGVEGPLCNGITANVVGTPGPDVLFGTVGDDSILALDGDDVIFGLGGDDTVCAGPGDDQVWTTWGRDWVSGDEGDDVIRTGRGDDVADGGPGNDDIFTGNGNDEALRGDGSDVLSAGSGGDMVLGGPGDDWIYAGDGGDVVSGEDGDDRIYSGSGMDAVFGNAGNDVITCGAGVDLADGGPGTDLASIDCEGQIDIP